MTKLRYAIAGVVLASTAILTGCSSDGELVAPNKSDLPTEAPVTKTTIPEKTETPKPTETKEVDPPTPSFGINKETKDRYSKLKQNEKDAAFTEMVSKRVDEDDEDYLFNLRDDVCSNLAADNSPGDVVAGLKDHTDWNSDDTSFFVGAAVLTRCPEEAA